MHANGWTLLLLAGLVYLGWKLRDRKGFTIPHNGLPAPTVHDVRCPICTGRIPGPLETEVNCTHCGSSWLPHDFARQGQLVCNCCKAPAVQRVQDPYDENLWQVSFRCGRVVAAYMLGEKREQCPCPKHPGPAPEGPDKSTETIPTKEETDEHEDMTFSADDDDLDDLLDRD